MKKLVFGLGLGAVLSAYIIWVLALKDQNLKRSNVPVLTAEPQEELILLTHKKDVSTQSEDAIVHELVDEETSSLTQEKDESLTKNSSVTKAIKVEEAFLVDGGGVSLDFIRNIDDADIFSTAINALRAESQNNILAQENKKMYQSLALNLVNKNLAANEDFDFNLNDIQCGEKTCLLSTTTNDMDMWDLFQRDLVSTENGIYTASHQSTVDEYGIIHHNVFISVDESVNSIVSSEPLGAVTLSNGTTINYERNDGGG
jgi:hypothetical protein